MIVRSRLSLLLAPMLATGCAVGPTYRAPQLAAPATFIGSGAIAERQAAQPVDLANWWEGFGDPVLSSLVVEAQANNLDVAQALARLTQAKAGLNAATAALLPSATVQAQVGHTESSAATPIGAVGSRLGLDRGYDLYEADLVAGWELDVFGGVRRGREAAAADYEGSAAGVVATRLALSAQVADTYVLIRGLQERLAIAHEQVETQGRLVETVRRQYAAGIAAELQLRQAEGVLSQVRASVPVLENGLEDAMNAVDVLLATQPGTHRAELSKPAPIPNAPAIADAGGPAQLLRRRPDLIVAERRLAASNARIGQAISEYFPKFSLAGLLGTATASGAGRLFGGAANQSQGTLGLRWRLFDFGRIDAEVKSARGANVEALGAYRQAVLRASEDVENSFSAVVRREEQARILGDGERSLRRARDASEAAYKGGVVSLIEVLDADTRLLATRDQRAQARTEAVRATVSSFRALGGGWNPSVSPVGS